VDALALALAICLGAAAPGDAGARPVWTEADALAAFEASSPALAEARAVEDAARADVAQAGLRPNPTLGLGASNIPLQTNPTWGNGAGIRNNVVGSVELDQPLELGGKRPRRVAVAKGALAGAALSRADAVRTARAELRLAFWGAVRARERRVLAEAVRARSGETLRIMRSRFENQDISALDLDKIELEAAQQENDLADAVAAERAAVADLLRLVGPGAPPDVEVSGSLASRAPPLDPARLATRARETRPDLAAARRQVETSRAALALAEAQVVPDVTVGVGYTRSKALLSGDNPQSLALTVSVPLPLFARNQGEIQKAHVEVRRAEDATRALEAAVAREVAAAHARYAAAAEKVARYDGGALARAERALTVAEKTYRSGDRSLLEFLEAERTFIAVRADYLDTMYELRAARLELEQAVGADLTEGA
jgi:cobalt-zinc-cadmium efflux system outer membrane protein